MTSRVNRTGFPVAPSSRHCLTLASFAFEVDTPFWGECVHHHRKLALVKSDKRVTPSGLYLLTSPDFGANTPSRFPQGTAFAQNHNTHLPARATTDMWFSLCPDGVALDKIFVCWCLRAQSSQGWFWDLPRVHLKTKTSQGTICLCPRSSNHPFPKRKGLVSPQGSVLFIAMYIYCKQ